LVAIREVDGGTNDLDKIFRTVTDANMVYTPPTMIVLLLLE
jgi:hypothetical protein